MLKTPFVWNTPGILHIFCNFNEKQKTGFILECKLQPTCLEQLIMYKQH
jgi:hypothetical protein